MLIQAIQLQKTYDTKEILGGVSFALSPKEKIGLIGKNGSGKTTLLKILAQKEDFDDGELSVGKTIQIGYVPQVPDVSDGMTVFDLLSQGNKLRHEIEKVLEELRIGDVVDSRLDQLSGGQVTKVYLARIALVTADVLLLDEPTNHLDMEGLRWLESYLARYEGSVVVISHDRYFLDQVVSQVWELVDGEIQVFGGNYTFYREQKEIQKQSELDTYQNQQKEVRRLKKVVKDKKQDAQRRNSDRLNERDNDKYTAHYFADRSTNIAAGAKAIETRLSHMTEVKAPAKESTLSLFFEPGSSSKKVVTIEDHVVMAPDGRELCTIKDWSVLSGDVIALQGDNGSGKTTLVESIIDHNSYDTIKVGGSIKIGYLSQTHYDLDDEKGVLEVLMSIEGIDKTQAYKIMFQISFAVDQAYQLVADLSPGEKTKLALARIMASGASLIMVDEPTNHLDFSSIKVLEDVLRDYRGTLLCISHDRYFLEQIGVTKYARIANNTIEISYI